MITLKDFLKRTWVEINLDLLAANYEYIAKLASPALVMAVVKADAYGHGDGLVARTLEAKGVRWFGVSNIGEAVSLRCQGIKGDILILGHTPPEMAKKLSDHGITQTVFSLEYANALSKEAKAAGVTVNAHLKVDTGMTRLGFRPVAEEIAPVYGIPSLHFTGIFTHFSCADTVDEFSDHYTRRQFTQFMQVCEGLSEMGISLGLRHSCNSAGTLRFPEMHLDMVRPGIILYGLVPSRDLCDDMGELKPVMELKTVVSMVKTVPEGTYVSYGATAKAEKEMQLATVPIGYADGYSRLASSKAQMLVGGKRAQVFGRVCMDQLMLDVTDIPVKAGDVVTVFGRDGEAFIPVEELSDVERTINYETVCLIGKRVPRVYLRGGDIVDVVDYIAKG